ncbi:MAG: hypothetical protein A2Z14_12025 [Chloroflexi bacterium RBG_16_48_8]|nr:MAG: hypothetical protein A2Z14_12025 [Chloroflexi bacterium RBG_16_48_8]
MHLEISSLQTPEEIELESKLSELGSLEKDLAQRELELATHIAELHALERKYLGIVGLRYAKLDEIEARIAEALASRSPHDHSARERAEKAQSQARESAQSTEDLGPYPERERFEPSDDIKKLFREVAKCIHPDLTTNEEERILRTKLMAEANKAYEEGDEARLRAILREWQSSPEAIEGEDTGSKLVRTIRKLSQVKERLKVIEIEITKLKTTDLYELKTKVEEAIREGRDLLAEMAARLDQQIKDAQERLAEIKESGISR